MSYLIFAHWGEGHDPVARESSLDEAIKVARLLAMGKLGARRKTPHHVVTVDTRVATAWTNGTVTRHDGADYEV